LHLLSLTCFPCCILWFPFHTTSTFPFPSLILYPIPIPIPFTFLLHHQYPYPVPFDSQAWFLLSCIDSFIPQMMFPTASYASQYMPSWSQCLSSVLCLLPFMPFWAFPYST
jgi:hypothetical protein